VTPLRATRSEEVLGLDLSQHSENAYVFTPSSQGYEPKSDALGALAKAH